MEKLGKIVLIKFYRKFPFNNSAVRMSEYLSFFMPEQLGAHLRDVIDWPPVTVVFK